MADYFSPYNNPYPYGYQKQYPTRVISGQDILELNGEQQQTLIGHTINYCNDLESSLNEAITKAEGYYNRLIELGDITPPKSPEEILKEQTEQQNKINETLLSTIKALNEKIERMEGANNARSEQNSNDSSESGSTGRSRKSARNVE